jgi:hypothetical protein
VSLEGSNTLTCEAAADARVRTALACIEEAQMCISRARAALSSVNGLCPEYEKLNRLYDQIHRSWYLVRDRAATVRGRGKLTLDHEPTEHESEWLPLNGGRS